MKLSSFFFVKRERREGEGERKRRNLDEYRYGEEYTRGEEEEEEGGEKLVENKRDGKSGGRGRVERGHCRLDGDKMR